MAGTSTNRFYIKFCSRRKLSDKIFRQIFVIASVDIYGIFKGHQAIVCGDKVICQAAHLFEIVAMARVVGKVAYFIGVGLYIEELFNGFLPCRQKSLFL
jgi:hypothetical protein